MMKVIGGAVGKGVVVVLPLANNAKGSNIMNLPVLSQEAGRFMIVSGVDSKGRKTETSLSGHDVFWLPALGIPEYTRQGVVVYGKGVSYSAALAGGIVGRLMAKYPQADAKTILNALRKSERPLVEGGKLSENVVNVKEAEALLRGPQ
jgi:hypothetical protein